MYLGSSHKVPDFNQIWVFSADFLRSPQYPLATSDPKSGPAEDQLKGTVYIPLDLTSHEVSVIASTKSHTETSPVGTSLTHADGHDGR
jgi:hypothetical protein